MVRLCMLQLRLREMSRAGWICGVEAMLMMHKLVIEIFPSDVSAMDVV